MKPGDIVRIYAPIAGKKKYHFCLCVGGEGEASHFLFLNSDDDYADTLSVDCSRIPFLSESRTGVTAICYSYVVKYNDRQLKLYDAHVLGEMPLDVLREMQTFISGVKSLTRNEKSLVSDVLDILCGD